MKSIKNQKGQTLLEVVVTIGVAMIIIGSLVALVNASTRRANLARQATQASKLTQEGMEIVRNIRDTDFRDAAGKGTVRAGSYSGGLCSVDPFCIWDDLYTDDQDDAAMSFLSYGCVANQWCLVETQPASEQALFGIFSRRVEIRDNRIGGFICSNLDLGLAQTKRVTVIVEWDSPIGTQERSATTCLTRWQQ